LKYRIIVDSREAVSAEKIIKGLQNYPDVEVVVKNLGQCVDYAIEGLTETHIIQRKKATEMISKKHVLEDIRGMCMIQDAKPYLLVEGTLSIIQKFTKWRPEPIIGVVESVLEDFNVKVISSPNQYWTTKWLVARARRIGKPREKKLRTLGYAVDLSLTPAEQARQILETFPKIGKNKSVPILQTYGNLWNALANVDDWHNKIQGIGKKITARVKEILTAEYERVK